MKCWAATFFCRGNAQSQPSLHRDSVNRNPANSIHNMIRKRIVDRWDFSVRSEDRDLESDIHYIFSSLLSLRPFIGQSLVC